MKKKPLKRTFRKIDPEGLRVFIANHPDAYLREMAKELHCSISGIRKALKCLGITRKKTTHYKEKDPEKVAKYEEEVKDIPKEKRAYVDPETRKIDQRNRLKMTLSYFRQRLYQFC